MINIGNTSISKLYLGASEAEKVYLGSTEVYSTSVPGFKIVANESSTVKIQTKSSNQTMAYSSDFTNWTSMTTSTTINLSAGQGVYIRGSISRPHSTSDYTQFTITGNVKLLGSIKYLFHYQEGGTAYYDYCGYKLFYQCTGITDISKLTFPSEVMGIYCFQYMFNGCTNITTAPPILPATTLSNYCYDGMFAGTGLTTAPTLPATTLAKYCYNSMFQNCSALTSAPELNATTLYEGCYSSMFKNCTALTTAPDLKASKLVTYSYSGMFNGCTSLNYIKCLATNISAQSCTSNWVKNVAASGTFVKKSTMTSWTTGVNGIPADWTVTNG